MKVSLVLTSRNREKELKRFFNCLINQFENIELVFIDQNEDSNVLYMEEFQALNSKGVVKYIHVKKQISLSKARNIGLQYVTGDIVGYPDDDCWYEIGFINSLKKLFIDNESIDVFLFGVFDPIKNCVYNGKTSKKRIDKLIGKRIVKYSTSVGLFHRRNDKLFFNEDFGVGEKWGGGEDLEFVSRCIYNKLNCRFFSSLRVYHQVTQRNYISLDKVYKYALGEGAFLKKAIVEYKQLSLIPYLLERLVKSLLGCLFNKPFYSKRFKGYIKGLLQG